MAVDRRAFVLQRTPPALISFLDRYTPTDVLETCASPTFLDQHDNGVGPRLFVTCFADGEIYVFDPAVPQLVKTFLVGRGPAGLVFDDRTAATSPTRSNFGDNDIAVIDSTPGSPTEYHVIQRIGFPRTITAMNAPLPELGRSSRFWASRWRRSRARRRRTSFPRTTSTGRRTSRSCAWARSTERDGASRRHVRRLRPADERLPPAARRPTRRQTQPARVDAQPHVRVRAQQRQRRSVGHRRRQLEARRSQQGDRRLRPRRRWARCPSRSRPPATAAGWSARTAARAICRWSIRRRCWRRVFAAQYNSGTACT